MMRRFVSVCVLSMGILALSASVAFADPPGNNGTVKIDGAEFSQHPNNEPHPGCLFDVEFWNFDAGVGDATVTFRLHPPTLGSNNLLLVDTVDNDADAAGGGQDFDGEELYDLSGPLAASGASPHPIQGFHVKLTVNAPGSIGADVKHKVFWVECDVRYAPSPEGPALTAGRVPAPVANGGWVLPVAFVVASLATLTLLGRRIGVRVVAKRG